MTTYSLIHDEVACILKIVSRRKWVGRVVPHAEGGYVARINGKPDTFARGATAEEAFRNVVAKRLGFESPQALRARNEEVRAANRAARARAKAELGSFIAAAIAARAR